MKELFFVRHGQTEWNAIRRMQGQWNADLNEIGRAQADQNGQFLKTQDIDYLVASPLDRTRQTADIINSHLNLSVSLDDRIKEWDCGDWSGEMWAQIADKWPTEWAAWQADQFNYRGPNCENYPDMIARSNPFIAELLALEHARIAIISHGIIGHVMVASLLHMNASQMRGFSQPNDTVFQLTIKDHSIGVQHYVGGEGPIGGLPVLEF